jgi:hypothetical protein
MDYYEELGIAPNASEEEIRRAYRRMTKLLHPDQQTDEGVKQLAEVQMRRLNSIVDALLDPERRREYDEHLREGLPFYPTVRSSGANPRRRRPSWPWWIASTAAAIVLTVVVVWFWANNLGSSFGNHAPTYIPADSREAPASAAEATPAPPAPVQTAKPEPRTIVPEPSPSKTIAQVPPPAKDESSQTKVVIEDRRNSSVHKTLVLPPTQIPAPVQRASINLPPPPRLSIPVTSHMDTAPLPVATLPAVPPKPPAEAPSSTKTVSYSAPAKAPPPDPLEGEWVYAPTQPEKKKAGFYPPEYIELKLFRNDGRLHGQYRARYHVTNKPVSPNVEFVLSPDAEDRKFVWQGPDGARGTFSIVSAADPNVIRIEWRTTVFPHQAALTAGTATLVKRSQ